MNVEKVHITSYSPKDGAYYGVGAGGGGIVMDKKYIDEPDAAWPAFCDGVYATTRTLENSGHVVLRNQAPWSQETPEEYRAWWHRVTGDEGDHDDARFCEVGWTPGANRNERRWNQ